MAMLIKADTLLDAWMKAADHLLDCGAILNLILAIESPRFGGGNATIGTIDKFLAEENQFPTHTVAETIFPGMEYRQRGLRGVLDFYPEEVYPAIKKHPSIRWGTYAYRLVRRRTAGGKHVNPLQQMIEKMQSEIATPGPTRSCYEIGVAEGEYDLPLYSPASDGARRMGGPCLSHLSFKLFQDAVHLTALYRSHDYRHKVPGNLLGLARLQDCVAREVGRPLGSLTVHSSYAYLGGSKADMRTLLKNLRQGKEREESRNVVAH